MQFELLADRPDALATVAGWYFDEWGRRAGEADAAGIREQLEGYLNRDCVPLLLLAVKAGEPVGAAELKFREMNGYPDRVHWLGGVYVAPTHRGRRVGAALVEHAGTVAASFGIERLYLQTERLDGGLYARLGWQPVERVYYKGLDVLVMERGLAP